MFKDVDEFKLENLRRRDLCSWEVGSESCHSVAVAQVSACFVLYYHISPAFRAGCCTFRMRRTPSAVQFSAGPWLIPTLGRVYRHLLRLGAAELQRVGKGPLPLSAFAGFHHTVVVIPLCASPL